MPCCQKRIREIIHGLLQGLLSTTIISVFISSLQNEKCGLRWLCKKCSDPFEYWYYQNIGRRVLDEPEWLGIVEKPDDEDEAEFIKLKCETMRQEFENNDKKQKKENVQKHVIQKAWGFRTSNSDKVRISVRVICRFEFFRIWMRLSLNFQKPKSRAFPILHLLPP